MPIDFQLRNALAESLQRIQPGVRIAILFGSLARGNSRADSDVDLAVDVGHPLSGAEKIALISEIAGLTSRAVDIVDLKTVGEPLLGQILKNGVRIAGTSSAYAELLLKHVFDVADFLPYRERILNARRRAWIGN